MDCIYTKINIRVTTEGDALACVTDVNPSDLIVAFPEATELRKATDAFLLALHRYQGLYGSFFRTPEPAHTHVATGTPLPAYSHEPVTPPHTHVTRSVEDVPATASPAPAAPASAPEPVTQVTYTLEQLSKAGAKLMDSNPDILPKLQALFGEYGIKQLSQLKPEFYADFANRLKAMGAKI